jgi:hypothetical protein
MQRASLAALITALLASPAYAQHPAPPEHPAAVVVIPPLHIAAADDANVQADAWRRWSENFSQEMRASMGTLFSGRMGSGKVVKGAPYSAEMVTEANQPLADGNVISKKTAGAVYRDGEGRTREESGASGKERSIFINDPVAGKHIVLSPGAKRAVVTPRAPVAIHEMKNKQVVKVDGTEIRIEDGKVFVNGRETSDAKVVVASKSGKEVKVENGKILVDGKEIGTGPGSGTHVIVNRVDSGDGVRREEVRVQVVRAGDDRVIPMPPIPPQPPGGLTAPLAPLPPMPGVSTLRFENMGKLGKGVAANLGTKDFDGVKAEGKSTTWTIPAGEIGNRAPIQVVSESWYSPELQVTVYSRYADPRTGESIFRLAGIRRGEPAAELFTTPEGYEVKSRARASDEARERVRQERDRAREQRQQERRKPG